MVAGPAPCAVMFTDGRAKLLNLREKIVSGAPMMNWKALPQNPLLTQ
jgi:hypothetical protein